MKLQEKISTLYNNADINKFMDNIIGYFKEKIQNLTNNSFKTEEINNNIDLQNSFFTIFYCFTLLSFSVLAEESHWDANFFQKKYGNKNTRVISPTTIEITMPAGVIKSESGIAKKIPLEKPVDKLTFEYKFSFGDNFDCSEGQVG